MIGKVNVDEGYYNYLLGRIDDLTKERDTLRDEVGKLKSSIEHLVESEESRFDKALSKLTSERDEAQKAYDYLNDNYTAEAKK